MTIARMAEQRSAVTVETRASGIGGYGWQDPSAIPPHGFDQLQRAGVLVTPETMLQVDVIFTALRIISNNVIRLGNMYAYTEGQWENIPYRNRLGKQPEILTDMWGGDMLPCTGIDRTVWSMGLFNEAYWITLLRDNRGKPIVLDVLHPAFMEVKQDDNGTRHYWYGSGSNKKELDPDDVSWIPHKSLPQARRALSPVKYAGVASSLAMAAYEFGASWFSQGAAPSYILSTDAKLGQEEVTRIAQRFVIDHSGLGNSHLPLVLDNGLKADKAMSTPDEAQYLQTLEYSRSVISSWFGLPMEWLGNALQRQTPPPPHSRQETTTTFIQNTLSGYTIPIEQTVSRYLPDGQQAGWDESALSKPDAQFQAMKITALRQSQVMSVNDVRVRELHIPPSDDPAADAAMAPLASNVSPEQTSSAGSEPDDTKETQP